MGQRFDFRPLDVRGVRGGVAVAGAGRPLVLLGSPLVGGRPYRPTAEHLAARGFRVWAIELPGSGTTPRVPGPWAVADAAGWAAAALDVLGLSDVTLVGHSHAGGVAVVLAGSFPRRVGRVVVVGGIGACRRSLSGVLWGRAVDTLTVEAGLAAREWGALARTLARHPRQFARQVRESLGQDLLGAAAAVRVPVLLAWGARDHTLPPRCADAYERALPRAERYTSAAGSHAWLVTHAGEFAAAVARFAGGPR